MYMKKLYILCFGLLLSIHFLIFPATVQANFASSLRDIWNKMVKPSPTPVPTEPQVKGTQSYNSESPRIYINGGNNAYSSGGLIMQAVTDDPAIFINGYQLPQSVEAKIYRASIDDAVKYLIHNKEYAQLNPKLNTESMTAVTSVTVDLNTGNSSDGVRQTLPIEGKGIWYIEITGEKVSASAMVIRSGYGVLVTESEGEFIFWAQQFTSLKAVGSASLKLYSMLDQQAELGSGTFDNDGLLKLPLTDRADVAIAQLGDDYAIVPINLTYLNTGYSYAQFSPLKTRSRYFTFTDRPLYLPGDTVYFKSVIRDDYDAQYSIPTGIAYVTLSQSGENQTKKEITVPISADGTVSGSFKLDADTKTGWYGLRIQTTRDKAAQNEYYGEYTGVYDVSYISFNVEHYRKPEMSLDISASSTDIIAGSPLAVTVSGSYFSGHPMSGQSIKYRVTAADYYEYAYLQENESYRSELSDNYRYGNWYGSQEILQGTATLDKQGHVSIEIPTELAYNDEGKSQVFMVEATNEDGSQDPAFARKNILIHAGKFSIFATDYVWGSKVNTDVSVPLKLVPNQPGSQVNGIEITATIDRSTWKVISDPSQKYPRYEEEKETLSPLTLTTDKEGRANLRFHPTTSGSYRLNLRAKDSENNTIGKELHLWVSSQDYPVYNPGSGNNDLNLTVEKKKYDASQKAHVTISSSIPDRDIFLAVERGTVRRFQVVHLSGKSQSIDLALNEGDLPNVYVSARSFSSYRLDVSNQNISLDTTGKKMNIEIKSDRTSYGPGDTVTLNLSTTTARGTPVSADVAVWTVDKALFELMDSRLSDIFKTFWTERTDTTSYSHSLRGITVQTAEAGGGCLVEGTTVTLSDGSRKRIEEIKIGDSLKTLNELGQSIDAPVTGTSAADEDGYISIDGILRLTADHLIHVNGSWVVAGRIRPGDVVQTLNGPHVVSDVSWQQNKVRVYNLEVGREHTFIADGIWVHNQKGGDRTLFKDVAYWNPSVKTDTSGRATLSFKVPDNLTTWVVSAVGNTTNTIVGQATAEFKTSKDIVIKPILPNVIRTGDDLTVSAVARNFTDHDDEYTVTLAVKGGDVKGATETKMAIKSQESQQLFWPLTLSQDASELELAFTVQSTSNAKNRDRVIQKIPVKPFGFSESSGVFHVGAGSIPLNLAADAYNLNSSVTVALAPSLVTSLQSAMKYLLAYPYGCVEQLTSRLIPALSAKMNPTFFKEAMGDKDVEEYITTGLDKLNSARTGGAWAWWGRGRVDPFVTSYVLEALVEARDLGYDDETREMINGATSWLQYMAATETISDEEKAVRNYGLSLVGKASSLFKPSSLETLDNDVLAMAVITNYRLGDKNPSTNGLNLLKERAKSEGESMYWEGGKKTRFGSEGASTAWAIRALVEAEDDRELASRGVRYLVQHRAHDYWYNSYVTSVTIRAVMALYGNGNEATPNYSYVVKLDGKTLKTGNISSAAAPISDITIPVNSINPNGSVVTVEKTGQGQLYTTIMKREFRTDKLAKSAGEKLQITRTYTNDRDPRYSIALGDIVRVTLNVTGFNTDDHFAVIEDQLPAGLIPINEAFKNEQYGTQNYQDTYWSGKEYGDNGVVISAYNAGQAASSYSYRARVVSMGTFQVPPATTSLMYAPEVSARSGVDSVVIEEESKLLPGKAAEDLLKKTPKKYFIYAGIFAVLAIGAIIGLRRRYIRRKREKEIVQSENSQPTVPPNPEPPHPIS